MARRPRHEEHENHERWLVSYADFITLLFAFFVVMYSVSSVNEGKYRVLSDSILAAFSGSTKTLSPIQVGEVMRAPANEGMAPPSSLVNLEFPGVRPPPEVVIQPQGQGQDVGIGPNPEEGKGQGPSAETEQGQGPSTETQQGEGPAPEAAKALDPQNPGSPMAKVDDVADELDDAFTDLVNDEFIAIHRKGDWIEVEMKSNFLFASGSSRMHGAAVVVIKRLANILKGFPNPVQVEGFTDDVPIHTPEFPSNWELSAGRAASVVHLLTKYNVRPDRLTAIGYGEFQPVAPNDSEVGRAKNRRVVIVIPAETHTRQFLDLKRTVDRARSQTVGGAP